MYFVTLPLLGNGCNTQTAASACQLSGLEIEAARKCWWNLLSTPVPLPLNPVPPSAPITEVQCALISQTTPLMFSTVEMDRSQGIFP